MEESFLTPHFSPFGSQNSVQVLHGTLHYTHIHTTAVMLWIKEEVERLNGFINFPYNKKCKQRITFIPPFSIRRNFYTENVVSDKEEISKELVGIVGICAVWNFDHALL